VPEPCGSNGIGLGAAAVTLAVTEGVLYAGASAEASRSIVSFFTGHPKETSSDLVTKFKNMSITRTVLGLGFEQSCKIVNNSPVVSCDSFACFISW
jgi:hypothetical protein